FSPRLRGATLLPCSMEQPLTASLCPEMRAGSFSGTTAAFLTATAPPRSTRSNWIPAGPSDITRTVPVTAATTTPETTTLTTTTGTTESTTTRTTQTTAPTTTAATETIRAATT